MANLKSHSERQPKEDKQPKVVSEEQGACKESVVNVQIGAVELYSEPMPATEF